MTYRPTSRRLTLRLGPFPSEHQLDDELDMYIVCGLRWLFSLGYHSALGGEEIVKFAYIDESGGRDQSDAFVMTGLLIDACRLRRNKRAPNGHRAVVRLLAPFVSD